MAWKQLNQMTFVDELIHEHETIKELDEIHELIDWKQIEKRLINESFARASIICYITIT